MAEKEPILTNPATQEMGAHIRDYDRFTAMFKWGTILSFIVAAIVVLIIAS